MSVDPGERLKRIVAIREALSKAETRTPKQETAIKYWKRRLAREEEGERCGALASDFTTRCVLPPGHTGVHSWVLS